MNDEKDHSASLLCGDASAQAETEPLPKLTTHELRMLRFAIEREIASRGAVVDGRNL